MIGLANSSPENLTSVEFTSVSPQKTETINETFEPVLMLIQTLTKKFTHLFAKMILSLDPGQVSIDSDTNSYVRDTFGILRNILLHSSNLNAEMSSISVFDGHSRNTISERKFTKDHLNHKRFTLQGEISFSFNIDEAIINMIADQKMLKHNITELVGQILGEFENFQGYSDVNRPEPELTEYLNHVKEMLTKSK